MKRFKMGVLNNFQTHKMYSTNPAAEKPEDKKTPPNPFANLPKP